MSIPVDTTIAPEDVEAHGYRKPTDASQDADVTQDVEAHMARYRPGCDGTTRSADVSSVDDVEAHMPRIRIDVRESDTPGFRVPECEETDTEDVEAHMPRVRFEAEDVDLPGRRNPGSIASSPGNKLPDDDVEAHGNKIP